MHTHTHTHTHIHTHTQTVGVMHTKSVHKVILKAEMRTNKNKQEQKCHAFFGFLSRPTTYLKATERGGINITKDTFINISNDRNFFIYALINLK